MDNWIEEKTSHLVNQKPEKCYESTCVTYKDEIYIFGGCKSEKLTRDYTFYNEVFKYNISTNIWSRVNWNRTKGIKPSPRSSHTSVVYDGKMFVFGGTGEKEFHNDFFSFDFETQTWKEIITLEKEEIPARYGHSAELFGDSMIVYGGYKQSNDNEIWMYHFLEKQWKKMIPSSENSILPDSTVYQSIG
jgi:N-acetylneuraminic acid mutarotase